jgi:hypothetical protein
MFLLACLLASLLACLCLQVLSSGTTLQTSRAPSLQADASQRSSETVRGWCYICTTAATAAAGLAVLVWCDAWSAAIENSSSAQLRCSRC